MLKRQPKTARLSDAIYLDKVTNRSNELKRLLKQAEQLKHFDLALQQSLPKPLKGHFMVNGLSKSALVLTCNSASLATRFRMGQKQVLLTLNRQLGLTLSEIKIKIRPGKHGSARSQSTRRLSKKNAQLLLTEAGQTEDQKLKNILEQLALRAEP